MDNKPLNGMRVAMLVTEGFEEIEMTNPRRALEEAGARVDLIAPEGSQVQAFQHHDRGDTFRVDVPLNEASPEVYDAVMLPGGALSADKLRMERLAQDFVRQMNDDHKPVAMICHAPWLLISARLVKGRTLTSYYTLQDDVRNAGGNWVSEEVVVDNNWVSSRNPDDLPAFVKAMIHLFRKEYVNERTIDREAEEETLDTEDLEGER